MRAAAAAIVAIVAMVDGGCWGQKFFRAPEQTLSTGVKVDSLLRENALLRERVARIERTLQKEGERERAASAGLKIDLEELKDQLNAIQELLREAQQPTLFKPAERRRPAPPDTAQVRAGTVPAEAERDATGAAAAAQEKESIAAAAGEADTEADTAGTYSIPAPPPEELYRQIYLDYSRREYRLVLEETGAFLEEYPDDPLGQEIFFLRGESLMELGRHLDALKEFSTLLQRYPGGKRAPGALLRMAVSYERMGQTELAAGVVRRLIGEYPHSSEAKTAKERFGSILQQ